MKKKGKILYTGLFCIICAGLFLLIATKSSPLYVYNDWVDSNIFFNIAKGIANGLVPYKDLFEQKGPILYFLYVIPYLISNDTFIGVYFLEVILFSITLFIVYKIVSLFAKEKATLLTLPIFAFLFLNVSAFVDGGSAEEICTPFIMLTFYFLIRMFKKDEIPSNKVLLINGICAGFVLWIKFTLLGFYLGYCFIIGVYLIKNKKFKEIIFSALFFLLGMVIVTIPVLIYFLVNNAIYDLFYNYFYVNITAYGGTESFVSKLIGPFTRFWEGSIADIFQTVMIFLGYIYLFWKLVIKEKKIFPFIMFVIILIFEIFFVYFGIRWTYYHLAFMPFLIFVLIPLAKIFEKITEKNFLFITETIVLVVVLMLISYKTNSSSYMISYKKEDVCYYKFSDIMHQFENPTLLVYNSIDANLFTVANIVPTQKYFFAANVDKEKFGDLLEKQNECIKNKEVDFVLLKYLWQMGDFSEIPGLEENYRFCGEDYYSLGNNEYFHFYLFELNELAESLENDNK